jgi:carbonic anhydrase
MQTYEKLLQQNRDWATGVVKTDPEFFTRLENLQEPDFLWIGCSDSRVPADQITGTHPGEIFVHRNIANMVVSTDTNMLSVLQYAVEVLKVKHVIVCGHYNCGGVKAAMGQHYYGIINGWINNIKEVYQIHRSELEQLDESTRFHRLVELNVQEQVINLSKTAIIQSAWQKEQRPHLHGWVYSLHDGIIKPVYEMPAGTPIDPLYEFGNLMMA